MSKLKKCFVLIFILLIMGMLFSTMISYQLSVRLPFFLIPISEYPFVGTILPETVFYLSSILLLFAIVSFFVVLFFPQKTTSFLFMKSSGALTISKKSIEGLVHEVIVNKQLMRNPTISAKMRKKKIAISVKGDLGYLEDMFSKTEDCAREIEKELHQLIGEEVKINIRIKFIEYKNKSENRVN